VSGKCLAPPRGVASQRERSAARPGVEEEEEEEEEVAEEEAEEAAEEEEEEAAEEEGEEGEAEEGAEEEAEAEEGAGAGGSCRRRARREVGRGPSMQSCASRGSSSSSGGGRRPDGAKCRSATAPGIHYDD